MTRLLVLFVTAFVDMMGLAMIVPLLPYYATAFGASALVVGLLISVFSLAQLLCAPVWGRFSDRYGRRPAILAGLLITVAAYTLFGFARSVPILLLARLIQGMGGGTIGVVQAYVADASVPGERTKSLGWLSAVTSLGAVAGPALGSALDTAGGPLAVGLGAAGISLMVAVFAWRFLRESRERRASTTFPASAITGRQALLRVLSHGGEPAARLIWIYAVGIGAFYGTIQTVPLLLSQRLGVTEHSIGYFVMYLGGMGVIVRSLILGRMVDWMGEVRLAQVGAVSLAAGLAVTGLAGTLPGIAVGFTLMPIGTGLMFPCVSGLLSQVVSADDRGLYMGVQHTFGGVSRVTFPIAAGFLMDQFTVGVPFWGSAVLVAATIPLASTLLSAEAMKHPGDESWRRPAADMTGEIPLEPSDG